MPSTFSKNLGLELVGTGEQPGVWGSTNNENLSYVDEVTGVSMLVASGSGVTVSVVDGAASTGRKRVLHFEGGTTGVTCTVSISPNDLEGFYIVVNESASTLTFQQGSGHTYQLDPGYSNIIYCDGAGSTAGVYGALENLQVAKLRTTGAVTFAGATSFTGTATFATLQVSGAAVFSGTVTTNGAVTMAGAVGITGGLTVSGVSSAFNSALTCNALLTLTQGLSLTGTGVALTSNVPVNFTAGAQISTPFAVVGSGAGMTINCQTLGVTASSGIFFSGAVLCAGTFQVNGPVTFNIGGDAPYDMYVRSSPGFIAKIPIGPVGTVLKVQPSGVPGWSSSDLAMGSSISGSSQGCLLFTWGGLLTQNGNLVWNHTANCLGIGAVAPQYSLHVKNDYDPTIAIDGASGPPRRIRFLSSGIGRFDLLLAGDLGLAISSYTDAGAALGTPFFLYRSNSHLCLGSSGDWGGTVNISAANPSTETALIIRGGSASGAIRHLTQWQRPNTGEVVALVREDGYIFCEGMAFWTTREDGTRQVTSSEDTLIQKLRENPDLRQRMRAALL